MKINKTTLKDLDDERMMIPLTFDLVFKGVFGRNLEVLKKIFSRCTLFRV